MSLSRMEEYIINLAAKVAELERRVECLEADKYARDVERVAEEIAKHIQESMRSVGVLR